MKRYALVILSLLVVLSMFIGGCKNVSRSSCRVLVVHSFERAYKPYSKINHYILSNFSKQGLDADIRYIYLDCESYLADEELCYMRNCLDSVTAKGWKPDVILVDDDQATFSLLKCDHPLTHTVPIVFAGVNFPNMPLIKSHPNVTGFIDKIYLFRNLSFIRQLLKHKTTVFTIIDSTFIDRKIRHEAEVQLKNMKVAGLTTPGLSLGQLDWLAKHRGYYLFTNYAIRRNNFRLSNFFWMLNKTAGNESYIQLKRDFTNITIGNLFANCSFTAINEEFDNGRRLIGGYFTPIDIQAGDMVRDAALILKGIPVRDIPIRQSAKRYMVDWEAAESHNIPLENIPSYCDIVNISFQDRHPLLWLLLVTLSLISLFGIFISLLVKVHKEKMKKEQAYGKMTQALKTLELAVKGGNTFAWSLSNGNLTFDSSFWDYMRMKSRPVNPKEIMFYLHPSFQDNYMNMLSNKKLHTQQSMQFLSKFGSDNYNWWELRSTSIEMEDGSLMTAGLLINIQEFKDHEAELEKARLLAEKSELKQSFVANMSHEIRTPLNAIVGFSTMLANGGEQLDEQTRNEYASLVMANNDALLRLVDEIFTLSKIDSGSVNIKHDHCRIFRVIETAFNNGQLFIPKHIQYTFECESEDREIITDEAHLQEVIGHLLRNAAKFTTRGSIKLGYRYHPSDNTVEIYVQDTGKGIPPEERDMIFSRFYKRDIFMEGAGLGLSVCKSMVEKMNGRIAVSSLEGRGSIFSIYLTA